MGKTIVEKIIAAHCEVQKISIGEIVMPKIDMAFANELGGGLAISGREYLLKKGVFDKSRIAIIPDHFTPNKDIRSAEQNKIVRNFAKKYAIEHYFEVGRAGIEHVVLHEKGLVGAGEIVVGADSHTCTYGALGAFGVSVGSTDFLFAMLLGEIWLVVPQTIKIIINGQMPELLTSKDLILHIIGKLGASGANYKVLEFCGKVIPQLSMDARFTLCNMAIESGAKSAIIAPDDITENYLKKRAQRPYRMYKSDNDAVYADVIEINVEDMDFQIACPHSPVNVQPLREVTKGEKLKIDQVFIGSCTNGRLEDLRLAARMIKSKKIHTDVRMIVIPGSQEVYADALEEGILKILVEAGAAVCTPTCGPCVGGHMGILASGERCISTSNRNFQGRMGDMESEVFLSGVPVAITSAIYGYIASPKEVL